MRRFTVTNLLILLACGIAFWMYRQHKNVQNATLVSEMTPELLSPARTDAPLVLYEGNQTELWQDRPYTTSANVKVLMGYSFVKLKRNEKKPYVIEAKKKTKVFTLGIENDTFGSSRWEALEDAVLVKDVVPARTFDQLLVTILEPGLYTISPRPGGPAQPIFFDSETVQLVR